MGEKERERESRPRIQTPFALLSGRSAGDEQVGAPDVASRKSTAERREREGEKERTRLGASPGQFVTPRGLLTLCCSSSSYLPLSYTDTCTQRRLASLSLSKSLSAEHSPLFWLSFALFEVARWMPYLSLCLSFFRRFFILLLCASSARSREWNGPRSSLYTARARILRVLTRASLKLP